MKINRINIIVIGKVGKGYENRNYVVRRNYLKWSSIEFFIIICVNNIRISLKKCFVVF